MKVIVHLLIIVCWTAFEVSCADKPHVKTLSGGINGYYKTSAGGRQYVAYESIPYAQSPIGELRFKPPVAIPAWSKDIDALKLPAACAQYASYKSAVDGVEDCLYLNIYTPTIDASAGLPVIFWIHGGGFQYGASSDFGPKFLMDKNVILVTVNYRLGPFGFISTGDDIVPGNMGFKDQSLALRWVSNNIQFFGGNSKRITLAGVSSGGASVHYHYLSPMSAGLFQNGISFSGSALARWAYGTDSYASETLKTLASTLSCPTTSSANIIQCLQKISANDISGAVKKLSDALPYPYDMYTPVAEKTKSNYFINDSPINIITKGKSYDVPWVTGVVSDEGLMVTAALAFNQKLIASVDANWSVVAPLMLFFPNSVAKDKYASLSDAAKQHYFGGRHLSTSRADIKALTNLIGDDQIVTGCVRAAQLHAKYNKSPVWFYLYSYRAATSISNFLSGTKEDLGVCHGDDVCMVLENPYINPTTTEKDKAMSQALLNLWTSVATSGKPDLGIAWKNVDSSNNLQYMHIAGPGDYSMKSNNNLGEISFWTGIGL